MAALQENAANRVDRQARGDDDERCIGQGSFHGRSIRAFRSVSQRNASRAIHPGVELPAIHPRLKYAGAPRMPEDGSRRRHEAARRPLQAHRDRGGTGARGLHDGPPVRARRRGIVGLEVKRKWVTIVNERLGRGGLATRGQVFAEDARLALPRLTPNGRGGRVLLSLPRSLVEEATPEETRARTEPSRRGRAPVATFGRALRANRCRGTSGALRDRDRCSRCFRQGGRHLGIGSARRKSLPGAKSSRTPGDRRCDSDLPAALHEI